MVMQLLLAPTATARTCDNVSRFTTGMCEAARTVIRVPIHFAVLGGCWIVKQRATMHRLGRFITLWRNHVDFEFSDCISSDITHRFD